MSCGKDAEKCKGKANSHGQPEATATWAAGRGGGGHCGRCGGFLDSGGVCRNPRCGTLTMSLAGGGILGIVDTAKDDEPKGICPQCGAELSVANGKEDWCLECEELVTTLTAEVVGYIRALGEDAASGVRERATEALRVIGGPVARSALEKALAGDAAPGVRAGAAEALGKIGGPAARSVLEKALGEDKDKYVRERAAEALGVIGEPARPALEKALGGDSDPFVRMWAAEALGVIGEPARPALEKALGEDAAPSVRAYAAEALGAIGEPAARSALEKALAEDTAPSVRAYAAKALGKIKGASK